MREKLLSIGDDPRLEWRRLFSELLGTFFLVLVAAGGGLLHAKGQITITLKPPNKHAGEGHGFKGPRYRRLLTNSSRAADKRRFNAAGRLLDYPHRQGVLPGPRAGGEGKRDQL